jgi:hypothetical protein
MFHKIGQFFRQGKKNECITETINDKTPIDSPEKTLDLDILEKFKNQNIFVFILI